MWVYVRTIAPVGKEETMKFVNLESAVTIHFEEDASGIEHCVLKFDTHNYERVYDKSAMDWIRDWAKSKSTKIGS